MKHKLKFVMPMLVVVMMLMSCDMMLTFPSVSPTPTGTYNTGQIIWHDLATHDPDAALAFYADVFGWEFETLGSEKSVYYVVKNNGTPIGGIFKLADKYGKSAEWISSMSVKDVEAALQYNEAAGGGTIFPKATFKGRGETALVKDPQGAFIAFLHSEGGDPLPKRPAQISMNSWLWNEIWTTDLDGSLAFYPGITKAETNEVPESKVPYYLFKTGNQIFSGALGTPVEGARSAWMPYIKVKDVKTTVAKAKAAGAYVMMEPNETIRKGTVAILMDPTGAQFAVQQWLSK